MKCPRYIVSVLVVHLLSGMFKLSTQDRMRSFMNLGMETIEARSRAFALWIAEIRVRLSSLEIIQCTVATLNA